MKKLLLVSAAMNVAPVAFANAPAAPAAPATGAGSKPRVEPELTAVSSAVPMPKRENNRGSKSLYPFDSLTAVGMSFGVKNKTATQLASIVSNANRKSIEPKRDADGAIIFKTTPLKDADGAIVGQTPTTDPETVQTRRYFAIEVDPKSDPDKAIARVFREL